MLKVGLVGVGRIARKHIEAVESLQDVGLELDAICDVDTSTLSSVAVAPGVARFPSLDELLGAKRIDVLVITTPSGLHARQAVSAAGRVPFIVVEKPMALSLADAQEMVDVCANSDTGLFVVKQNRYNDAIQRVRLGVQEGLLGNLHLATCRVRWTRTPDYYDAADWRGTRTMDGSVIWNQASHHLDLLSMFLGPVESAFAYGQTALARVEVEDTVVGVAKFAAGRIGVIEATTAVRPTDLEGSISLLGSRGSAVVGGYAVNELQSFVHEGQEAIDTSSENYANEFPSDVYGFGHRKFYSHLADHIIRGTPFELTGQNSLETVRLIEMLDRSVREGREIVRS